MPLDFMKFVETIFYSPRLTVSLTKPMYSDSKTKKGLVFIALGSFILHVVCTLLFSYGYFRDELYYIACTENLAWGYVDHPPLSIYILLIFRSIFGDALWSIRLFSAVAHALLVWTSGTIALEMGGKRFAVWTSALLVYVVPIYLAMFSFYSMNSLDILLWAVTFLIVVKLINTQRAAWWYVLGVVLGLGLLNKISFLFLGAGIFVGVVLTNRQWLKTKEPYIAALIALIIFSPYIGWNLLHDNAHLEFIHNASTYKYGARNYGDFITEVILGQNPVSIPLWMSGLLMLLFYKPLRAYRILGLIFLTVTLILVFNKTSKGEYLAAVFSILYVAYSVGIEKWATTSFRKIVACGLPVGMVISTLILLPIIRPVLAVESYIAYADALGFKPSSSENKEVSALPQFYADMFGWEEKAKAVAQVYHALTEEEKQKVAIYSDNYGRNGALDFFGAKYGIPKTIGSHNNYWIWGPREHTGEIMILLGGRLENQLKSFESCEEVAVVTCDYCMPYENNVPIFIGRGLKFSLQQDWHLVKHYD
jgi:hypothetical protein